MDRLTPLDASFLFAEDGKSHTDIGMVLEFDGPPLSRDELAESIRSRLPLIPRYRQKVKLVPGAAALPVWVDDVRFDIHRHVFEAEAAAPGDEEALEDAVSRVMSSQLDRGKPLWEAHLVIGLANERWAVILRLHHAMADGLTSTAMTSALLTTTPEATEPIPDAWSPRPEPSDWELLQSAAVENAKAMAEMAHQAVTALSTPPDWSSSLPSGMDLEPLRQVGQPPFDPTLTGPVGTERLFRRFFVELDDIRQIRLALGGTVNDVLLAMSARAFRALMLRRGEAVLGRSVRALVPVALHTEATAGGGSVGNQIGAIPVELPLGELTVVECLDRVKTQTETLKRLGKAVPAAQQAVMPQFGMPTLLTLGSRIAGTLPSYVHTVISNVPGPREPLYLQGRRLTAMSACISLWSPMRIAVQAMSYTGTLAYAAVADAASVPDLPSFMEGAEAGLRELQDEADRTQAGP